ncbi:SKP1-like protein 1A isoform X1 [Physcomitrium patens]|nr:SKP1-like protein 1A isoform X1 [Physcomitrium patens]XP_024374230.1 SKP1-like protein 1A isoform X1 [Physcomitrium patens]XP_024374243.1 SKP1-like protein 1A isoform X1 [Physcomitrium patens]XP_024374252.1 SKP1-like protein 1A isoform X1 [Physcomitrium patens]|eukprot:XP_024374220.1 SKP1-like protein 1A isoform X1 [Physcomitrella patens]
MHFQGSPNMAEKRVKLISSDNDEFEVDEAVAFESETLRNMIQDTGTNVPISIPNVSSDILAKVLEYCSYHAETMETHDDKPPITDAQIREWDADFVDVHPATLYSLILAANYLNIKNLLDLICQAVANNIRGKTAVEIRKILHIQDDFTYEEEMEIRRETKWAFD